MIPLDDLRYLQVKFEGSRKDYLSEYNKLESLRKKFIRKFPMPNINKMTKREYVVGFGPENESFCYWLETKLMPLGKIKGGTTADKKFGIYLKFRA